MFVLLLALSSAQAQSTRTTTTTTCGGSALPVGAEAACACWYASASVWWDGDGASWAAVDDSVAPADVAGTCFELTAIVNAVVDPADRQTVGAYLEHQGKKYGRYEDFAFAATWGATPLPWVVDQSLVSMDEGEAIMGPAANVSFTPTLPFEGLMAWQVRIDHVPVTTLVTGTHAPTRGYVLDDDGDGLLDLVVQIDGNDTWVGHGPLDPAGWLLPPS